MEFFSVGFGKMFLAQEKRENSLTFYDFFGNYKISEEYA